MKDKNGFLLVSETLKIVIAVICIGFLIYLLVSLYFANVNKEKTIYAENILNGKNGIVSEIERVNIGAGNLEEGNAQEFTIGNPAGWYLFSFIENNKKPDSCAGENCLCICPKALIDILGMNQQIKKCDKDGVCAMVSELKEFDKIKINNPSSSLTEILIKQINNQIEISEIK